MSRSTITGINQLPVKEKREVYSRIIPQALLDRFNLSTDFLDEFGNDLLSFKFAAESPSVEMMLMHQFGFPDRMPDGQNTVFGTQTRNLEAEIAAIKADLSPGQVHRGLGLLSKAILSFEDFVISLGHDIYFVDPLYYHNAVIFEKYGFAYQKGRKLMERIQSGFSPDGDLIGKLDSSSPFRIPEASSSIRLRSWAIHDGILGESFSDVTMYKYVGKKAGIDTCFDCTW
jgi:hypothetical protein